MRRTEPQVPGEEILQGAGAPVAPNHHHLRPAGERLFRGRHGGDFRDLHLQGPDPQGQDHDVQDDRTGPHPRRVFPRHVLPRPPWPLPGRVSDRVGQAGTGGHQRKAEGPPAPQLEHVVHRGECHHGGGAPAGARPGADPGPRPVRGRRAEGRCGGRREWRRCDAGRRRGRGGKEEEGGGVGQEGGGGGQEGRQLGQGSRPEDPAGGHQQLCGAHGPGGGGLARRGGGKDGSPRSARNRHGGGQEQPRGVRLRHSRPGEAVRRPAQVPPRERRGRVCEEPGRHGGVAVRGGGGDRYQNRLLGKAQGPPRHR
mmetsp:Transcript_24357/g.68282  ORF Transcript_24357/g.68282 Transcript_24357/m.68282 type:complete len:311 (-) Transcript_24357:149-1081(-)